MLSAPNDDTTWTVAGAKERLSEIIARARSVPQAITRNGKPRVVVVSRNGSARRCAKARFRSP